MTQCSAHATFEKMFQQSIDNLAESIRAGIASLAQQSVANGDDLSQVLKNQADRRELCGKQGARLDGAEDDIRNIWKVTADLRRLVYMFAGGLVVVQVLVTVGAAYAVRLIAG